MGTTGCLVQMPDVQNARVAFHRALGPRTRFLEDHETAKPYRILEARAGGGGTKDLVAVLSPSVTAVDQVACIATE